MKELIPITDANTQREQIRLNMRTAAENLAEILNRDIRTNYEARLKNWEGEAERAAGMKQPLPQKPPVPGKLVVSPEDGTWNIMLLVGGPIEFTDVVVDVPYSVGFFGPQEFLGVNMMGEAIYNAKPGDQYLHGAEFTDGRGKFRKVRGAFNAGGGGFWVKVQ